MSKLVASSILIPVLPLLSALFIGTLLACFNRTMNRLTKPVSFLLINSVAFSTLYSLFLLYKHVKGEVILAPFQAFDFAYKIDLILNNVSETCVSVVGFIGIVVMLTSYIKSTRSKGYVRYLVTLSSFFGVTFLFLLSDTFLDLVAF